MYEFVQNNIQNVVIFIVNIQIDVTCSLFKICQRVSSKVLCVVV